MADREKLIELYELTRMVWDEAAARLASLRARDDVLKTRIDDLSSHGVPSDPIEHQVGLVAARARWLHKQRLALNNERAKLLSTAAEAEAEARTAFARMQAAAKLAGQPDAAG